MKYKIFKWFACIFKFLATLFKPLSKLAIGFILIVIVYVSCAETIDSRKLKNRVIAAATEATYNHGYNIADDSSVCAKDSSEVITICVKDSSGVITICVKDSSGVKKEYTFDKRDDNKLSSFNFKINNSQQKVSIPEYSVLDILSKSDELLSSNALTFCVTMIVSLLASLLLFRIDKMDKLVAANKRLVEKNALFKEEIKGLNEKLLKDSKDANDKLLQDSKEANDKLQKLSRTYYKVANILTRIESAFNMSIIIGNMTTTLLHANKNVKNDIAENIANQCSRLSLLCSDIVTRLNNPDTKLDFLTVDEDNIINMYLEDTLDALNRSLKIVSGKKTFILELTSIIENNRRCVEDIKDIIDSVEVKNEI